MAYDTIKLRSPYFLPDVDAGQSTYSTVFERIKQKCILRQGTDLESGELLYELHTGELLGSWDARISVQPKTEEYVTDANGRPQLVDCLPYILVECSVHKAQYGQNVFGGSSDFDACCDFLVNLLENLLEVKLQEYKYWQVLKVDVAYMYRLSKPACKQFFDGLQLITFPRRQKKASKYDMAVHFPGNTTTIKIYHKGTEFKEHDYARLRAYFRLQYLKDAGEGSAPLERAERKVKALQRLADNRLRVEVSILSDKFIYDFGKKPRVHELTDEYLHAVHAAEIERFLREGKQGMQTVRTTQQVQARLNTQYGKVKGMRLYGFWSSLVTLGDEATKCEYTKPTFFRNRKHLEEAGVSWRGSNVHVIANDCALPADFSPLPHDIRLCNLPARSRPEFSMNSAVLNLAA